MAKKENNDKNHGAAEAFKRRKAEGRPKQRWDAETKTWVKEG